jgi:RHS repeat-associated protein
MKRIPSVALGRHLLVIAGLALASTVGSLSAADTYYVSDHLATTTAVADAAGEIASLEADAFGSPVSGGEQAARYTGKPYDADMGAYVFPFRNYRSEEARWMSADPSGFPDGVNGRFYSPNLNSEVDPFGLVSVVVKEFYEEVKTNTLSNGAVAGFAILGAGGTAALTKNPFGAVAGLVAGAVISIEVAYDLFKNGIYNEQQVGDPRTPGRKVAEVSDNFINSYQYRSPYENVDSIVFSRSFGLTSITMTALIKSSKVYYYASGTE